MTFRIREARIAAGLTQDQLAKKLGIRNTTLSGYETGVHDPKSNMLAEIAGICGVTVDFLLGVAPEPKEKEPAHMDGLADDESELLAIYRDLNATGQGTLMNVARGLDANPDMKKGGISVAGTG